MEYCASHSILGYYLCVFAVMDGELSGIIFMRLFLSLSFYYYFSHAQSQIVSFTVHYLLFLSCLVLEKCGKSHCLFGLFHRSCLMLSLRES